jgi:all-trans-8'-apo-beta-carotenal 15,15'-oxygenase
MLHVCFATLSLLLASEGLVVKSPTTKTLRPALSASSIDEIVQNSPKSNELSFDQEAWRRGYSTCTDEVCAVLPGVFPSDIKGTYYKNGMARFEFGKDLVLHPFDGDGMVFAITIEDGKAIFRNRFVRTKGYVQESRYKRIMNRGVFGTKKSGFLANIFDINFKNTGNTNVLYWDKKLFALQEGGIPHYLEPDSLHTLGMYTFRGTLSKAKDRCTAHPR